MKGRRASSRGRLRGSERERPCRCSRGALRAPRRFPRVCREFARRVESAPARRAKPSWRSRPHLRISLRTQSRTRARQSRTQGTNPAHEKHTAALAPHTPPPTPHTGGQPRTRETYCGLNPSNTPRHVRTQRANPTHKGRAAYLCLPAFRVPGIGCGCGPRAMPGGRSTGPYRSVPIQRRRRLTPSATVPAARKATATAARPAPAKPVLASTPFKDGVEVPGVPLPGVFPPGVSPPGVSGFDT